MAMQLASDLLSSKDGSMMGERRQPNDPQVVKLFNTNADIVFVTEFPHPRYGPSYFFVTIKSLLKTLYELELEFTQWGKPEKRTFEFAEKELRQKAKEQGIDVTNFYMIGDNPYSDIQGAHSQGWKSILVRTGVFNGQENDPLHPAHYVVQDFTDAIELIYRLEGLNNE